MWSIRKEIKWNCYWDRTALWEFYYKEAPSWKKILMEKCRCKCWVEKYVQRRHLLSWASKNCWCENIKRLTELWKSNKKHWMDWTIPYKKFMSAKSRCTNPANDSYYRYGWRGIKVERKDFEDFWKDMWPSYYEHVKEYWAKDTTLERINNNWNYCKENCRWATQQEQYENKSNNHNVIYKWKHYPTIAKLCREKWVKIQLVRDRLRLGRTVEDAVDKPLLNNSVEINEYYKRGESPSPHTLAHVAD